MGVKFDKNGKQELTERQRRFCEEYIKTGNATKSAIAAGYSEKTAKQTGYDNLAKPYLMEYIQSETAKMTDKNIADAKEVMSFLTSAMRGEVLDQFGLDPTLGDRLDAAKQLQKRYGLDKVAIVGGEKEDESVKVEAVQIYLPDNDR